MHLSEKGSFHVWAVLRGSSEVHFIVEMLQKLFQVQGRDRSKSGV